jgi:hypothetical protein
VYIYIYITPLPPPPPPPTPMRSPCHRLNAAPWLWLPEAASATDSFHVGLASLLLEHLNPDLPVFFEFAHGLLYNQVLRRTQLRGILPRHAARC